MKVLLSILLLGSVGLALGQYRFDKDEFLRVNESGKPKKHYVKIEGINFGYSDAITNDLINSSFKESTVDQSTKNNIYNKLGKTNALGAETYGAFTYKYNLGKGNLSFRFQDRTVSYSYFNEDFFKLFTSGNKAYEDQQVELSPYEYLKLDYIGFNVGYETTVDNWNIGGGISYFRLLYSRSIQLTDTYFYTAPYGEYLEMSGQFDIHSSGKEGSRYSRNHGSGFGLDFFLSRKFDNESRLSFSVQDLGVIYSKELESFYEADTSVRFEGAEINNEFSITSANNSSFDATDDLESVLGLKNKPSKTKYIVPAIFHLNYYKPINEKISVDVGARYLLSAHKIPSFYTRGNFKVLNAVMISPILSYGGFSSFDLGLGLGADVGDFLHINLDLFYLESLIAPATTATQGASITLSGYF